MSRGPLAADRPCFGLIPRNIDSVLCTYVRETNSNMPLALLRRSPIGCTYRYGVYLLYTATGERAPRSRHPAAMWRPTAVENHGADSPNPRATEPIRQARTKRSKIAASFRTIQSDLSPVVMSVVTPPRRPPILWPIGSTGYALHHYMPRRRLLPPAPVPIMNLYE